MTTVTKETLEGHIRMAISLGMVKEAVAVLMNAWDTGIVGGKEYDRLWLLISKALRTR